MRDVGYRVLNLTLMLNMQERLKQCDFVIEPKTGDFTIFDVSRSNLIYDAGYEAALPAAESISKLLRD